MRPLAQSDLEHVLDHTREAWTEARGARLFVTGGTGFFGCWLLESFCHINRRLRLGARVVALTRDRKRFAVKAPWLADAPEVDLLEGDAKNFAHPAGNFDYAIHAATETRPGYATVEPATLLVENLAGTQRFLDLVHGRGVRKFLFTSSGAVYGAQPASLERIREQDQLAPDPMNPAAAYGESKRAAELLCAAAVRPGQCEGKVARCFAFVGPHLPLDANYAIGNFLQDALAGRPLRISGDGTPRRSYLYAADLAIWLWTILFRGRTGAAYNVGSGRHRAIREIAEAVREAIAPGIPIELAREPVPGIAPHRYVPDVTLACTELGLDEWIDLETSIRRTAAWHRAPGPMDTLS